jgi:hypothetical protein
MCGFYAAMVQRILARCGVAGRVVVGHCKASGDPSCLLSVTILGALQPQTIADLPSPSEEAA